MAASRLKGKPLLEINKLPIICHVVEKAKAAGIGDVIVATEDNEIVAAVKKMVAKQFLQEFIKLELIEYLKPLKN